MITDHMIMSILQMSKVGCHGNRYLTSITPLITDEMVICQESLKEMLEEYIFPHYGVNNVQ